jgi:hypothetical protein
MKIEYERVNEPMVDKLSRVAQSYRAGRISCPHPYDVARQLDEIADRIRRMHADKAGRP